VAGETETETETGMATKTKITSSRWLNEWGKTTGIAPVVSSDFVH
jgi:hypothetical protein